MINTTSRTSILIVFLSFSALGIGACADRGSSNPLPDFSVYTDVKQKKTAFFNYIFPLIEEQNQLIRIQRVKLLDLVGTTIEPLNNADQNFIEELAGYYKVDIDQPNKTVINKLLLRVDEVPASLALAQAAMESAWGTSRFAVQANNLFGQWCYQEGCGLVPLRRNPGSKHEVAKFESVSDAIRSYLRNINTHRAYSGLREHRSGLLNQGNRVSGHLLAGNLIEYSELREAYVHEIQAIIRINKLDQYDADLME
jgi:Bax protein